MTVRCAVLHIRPCRADDLFVDGAEARIGRKVNAEPEPVNTFRGVRP